MARANKSAPRGAYLHVCVLCLRMGYLYCSIPIMPITNNTTMSPGNPFHAARQATFVYVGGVAFPLAR